MYDVLIIGGGVSGISCALVLGSAQNKAFMSDKKIGLIAHQKNSSLNNALINNCFGIAPETPGADLLSNEINRLTNFFPHIDQINDEKVLIVEGKYPEFEVFTNKNSYKTKNIVIGIGSSNTFAIEGLTQFVEPHKKSLPEKLQIQLKNTDYKVAEGIYVSGTLSGHRSQVAIAVGSGAAVATELLTVWNGGNSTHVHDSVKK
ncbi:MAG: FAD-dependent oxidoreductase [Flavobacterium sp.]